MIFVTFHSQYVFSEIDGIKTKIETDFNRHAFQVKNENQLCQLEKHRLNQPSNLLPYGEVQNNQNYQLDVCGDFFFIFVNWSATSRRVITPKNVHLVMMSIDRCNCLLYGLSLNHTLSRTSTQTHCKYISVLIARQSPLSSQKRFLTPYAHICVCIYFFE